MKDIESGDSAILIPVSPEEEAAIKELFTAFFDENNDERSVQALRWSLEDKHGEFAIKSVLEKIFS
jgi:hypothetical protein